MRRLFSMSYIILCDQIFFQTTNRMQMNGAETKKAGAPETKTITKRVSFPCFFKASNHFSTCYFLVLNPVLTSNTSNDALLNRHMPKGVLPLGLYAHTINKERRKHFTTIYAT